MERKEKDGEEGEDDRWVKGDMVILLFFSSENDLFT
jgi:hypothetical protein